MSGEPFLKPVIWVGSSRKDLRHFPSRSRITWDMPCTLRSAAVNIATRKR
jgi:hypothetical protein